MKIKGVPLIALKRDAMSKNMFLVGGKKEKKKAVAFVEKVRQRFVDMLSKVYSKAETSLRSRTSLVELFIRRPTVV